MSISESLDDFATSLRHSLQFSSLPERKDHARAILFARLQILQDIGREVSTHINNLSMAVGLPNELLARIFLEVRALHTNRWNRRIVDGEYNDLGNEEPRPSDLRWVRVSQVCQRWRTVALCCPELWSDIQLLPTRANFVNMQLERSKNVPISVQAHVVMVKHAFVHDTLVSPGLVQRLGSLELSVGPFGGSEVDGILKCFGAPVPQLRQLCISGNTEGFNCAIQKQLFAGLAPRLQDLTLYNCESIDWDWPPLTQETLLHLRIRHRTTTTLPTLAQLHKILAKLPSTLRTLELPDTQVGSPSDDCLSVLNFDQLERLSVSGMPQATSSILKLLRVPLSNWTSVECNVNPWSTEYEFQTLISAISCLRSIELKPRQLLIKTNPAYPTDAIYQEYRDEYGDPDFHIIAINSPSQLEFEYDCSLSLEEVREISPTPLVDLKLYDARPPGPFDPSGFAPFSNSSPLTGLSLSQLTELYIRSNNWEWRIENEGIVLRDGFWNELARLPCLEVLDLTATNIRRLAFLLARSSEDIMSPEHPIPRFPSLHRVTLTAVAGFEHRVGTPGGTRTTRLEALLNNVVVRAKWGTGRAYSRVDLVWCVFDNEEYVRSRVCELGLEDTVFIS